MNTMDQIRYDAFFDELGHIEKRAMLEKVAVVPGAMGLKNLWGVGKLMAKHPTQTARTLGRVAQTGYSGAAKGHSGWGGLARGAGGAAKSLWGTPAGRVALVGGGGLALGAAGTAFGAGRLSKS